MLGRFVVSLFSLFVLALVFSSVLIAEAPDAAFKLAAEGPLPDSWQEIVGAILAAIVSIWGAIFGRKRYIERRDRHPRL